ncbi:MAG: hypothetical protein A3G34_14680 [Candidatus Lindowbacteria bacterium RIFCSPLOWO2_12_FULL_62_27]|nr:MAG: hypothetical protein A3I06_14650 [Candidatus Lindowbacteria bacterium RIFCSPLOWO2_02_FULL_62_12]OGH63104.1 MAG: hypothetical protein A3G34_14680 [Candidatus Lindowbacteria bacterium RIFCSPLOWO2_12_FULL_62_27]
MVKIAAENPFYRDATFSLLGPPVTLAGASMTVGDLPVRTSPLKDTTKSEQLGPNAVTPGRTLDLKTGTSNLGQTGIGSDTLFEIQNGIEILDHGKFSPVDRVPSHYRTQYLSGEIDRLSDPPKDLDPSHNRTSGTELEDTGQTPVWIKVQFNPEAAATRALIEETVAGETRPFVPQAYVLPRIPPPDSVGPRVDLLA